MKRKAISELTPTLKERQRFPIASTLCFYNRAIKLGKIRKLQRNWKKNAPQTDFVSVTEDKTLNGATNKQQLSENSSYINASVHHFHSLVFGSSVLINWQLGGPVWPVSFTQDHWMHHLTAAWESRVTSFLLPAPLIYINRKSANQSGNIYPEKTAKAGTTPVRHHLQIPVRRGNKQICHGWHFKEVV